MSPDAVAHIRASWAQLAPQADALADEFYTALLARAPEVAPLFAHVDMAAQRRKFLAMLAELVRVADDPGALVTGSVPAGRRHVEYGAADAHYAVVGEVLLGVVGARLDPASRAEAVEAWRELYALVSAVMRRAASRHGRPAPVG